MLLEVLYMSNTATYLEFDDCKHLNTKEIVPHKSYRDLGISSQTCCLDCKAIIGSTKTEST